MNNKMTLETKQQEPDKILLVDDNATNLQVLHQTLDGRGFRLLVAKNGESALSIATKAHPSLILLDIMMPGIDGFEVCRRLQSNPDTQEIPVIFLSALDDTKDKVKGLDAGAVDYVSKPFQPEEVIARVNTHLTISRLKKTLAEKNQELLAANDVLEERVRERTAELAALNHVYERFVPREFLDLLNKESILDIQLGDQVIQEMTVMFADIRGWTTLSEQMTPQENFHFINAYLKRVSPVIKEHNGFIDQYYGDGIMALFPGPPDDAVMAAISMRRAVNQYNEDRKREGFLPIGIGIGLHHCELMLGIIGSEERLQGAVVADAVNLAARIEGLTRIYGSWITTSEVTVSRLGEPERFKLRFVDKVLVKGRKTPVSVYEVFDGSTESEVRSKEQSRAMFEEGLKLYYGKRFSEASVQFNHVLEKNSEDKAARIYLKRCANYMVNGVPQDWTGVEDLTKK
jgi:two-component system sensor histidine kinase ChiS